MVRLVVPDDLSLPNREFPPPPSPLSFSSMALSKETVVLGEKTLALMKGMVSKQYTGDLFSQYDNTDGMLYLSRLIPGGPASTLSQTDRAKVKDSRFQTSNADAEKKRSLSGVGTWKLTHSLERKKRFALSLSSISAKPEKREQIVREGAIAVILKLATVRDKQTVTSCAHALYNLALEPNLRIKIIESNAVPVLIDMIMSGLSKIKVLCAQCVCNLSACKGSEFLLVQEGVIPAMLALSAASAQFMHITLMTLLNLSCVDSAYNRIEEVDDAALQLATFSLTPEMEALVLKCLCNLSGLRNNQTKLIEEGLVTLVSSITKTSPSPTSKLWCSKIFSNLASCHKSRHKMVDQKVMLPLQVLLDGDVPEIQEQAILCITRLAGDVASREKLIQQGAVTAILKATICPNNATETLRSCAIALRTFAGDQFSAKKLVKDGGIRALLNIMSATTDSATRQDCCRALCGLYQHKDLVQKLVDEEAIRAIITLADPSEKAASAFVTSALYALSWHPLCSPEIMDEDVVTALNRLCECEVLDTRKRAVATLWSLTQNKEKSADPAPCIPYLLRILRDNHDSDITRLCAAALCNLASCLKNVQSVIEEGAVSPMIDLCSTNNISTKIQCGAILCRLSAEVNNRTTLTTPQYLKLLLSLCKVNSQMKNTPYYLVPS